MKDIKISLSGLRALLVFTLLSPLLAAGCTDGNPTGTPTSELVGTVSEAGSTTVQPLAEKLAQGFETLHPRVKVEVQGGGSSVGVRSAANGVVDIGAISRELQPNEPPLNANRIALDGVAVVVNPANPVSNLTLEQLRGIYAGTITNWKQVGGTDGTIIIVSREEGSGTRTAFEEMVMKKTFITNNAIFMPANGIIKTTVAQADNAMGYISLGYVDRNVKVLAVDGVQCSSDNILNGTYPISRSLYFVTPETPAGLVKAFIDFSIGAAGQKIVAQQGFVPLKTG